MSKSVSCIFRKYSYILMLKVCFKTITKAKSTRITKEGLQRSKCSKAKMNEDLLKLANVWSITKSLQGAEATTQRCSIKNVFRNCTKFTEKSIWRNLSFNKIAGMSTATLLTPSQLFSCEFHAVFKDTYSVHHLWRVALEYEWHTDLPFILILEWWRTALWSISIYMWRVWKEHLGRHIYREYLLVSQLSFQLNTKKNHTL